VLRLLRLVRAMRMVPYLDQAWKLVYGIVSSKKTILSMAVLLFIMLYMFACIGVEVITKDAELHDFPDFDALFGTIPRMMLTLTQFVTMDSIASLYGPLIIRKPLLALYFLPIILLVSISVMNLVTAFLVEVALSQSEASRQDTAVQLRKQLQKKIPDFNSLFESLDVDGDGKIAFEELQHVDSSYFTGILEYLHMESMVELFDVFDADESGELTQDEFVEGLVSLLAAQQVGISQEMYMVMTCLSVMKRSFHRINESLAVLHKQVAHSHSLLSESHPVSPSVSPKQVRHEADVDEQQPDEWVSTQWTCQ